MKLAKITCEIRFLERIRLLDGYKAVYRDLLKKEPEEAERWLIPGLRIEDKEQKRVMVIDPIRSVINVEQPPNVGFCRDSVMQFFGSVNTRLGIPHVARYGLRSTWLQEFKGTFDELLKTYKQRIFSSQGLAEKAFDVGAVFDYHGKDGHKLSVTTGPMQIEQLTSQFLVFKPESLPSVFLYVDVDLGDTRTKEFSEKYLRSFFDEAVQEGERLSTEVISQLGVK